MTPLLRNKRVLAGAGLLVLLLLVLFWPEKAAVDLAPVERGPLQVTVEDEGETRVRDRFVVPNGDDLHPFPRVTFTFPALARSRVVVFTVEGESKREALGRVRAGEDVPAAHVTAERVIWLVDAAAHG